MFFFFIVEMKDLVFSGITFTADTENHLLLFFVFISDNTVCLFVCMLGVFFPPLNLNVRLYIKFA